MIKSLPFAAASLALVLAACSPNASNTAAQAANGSVGQDAGASPAIPANDAVPVPPPTADGISNAAAPDHAGFSAAGLGVLRIGEAVPAGSGWAERGAQISDGCRTISSPDHQGVYAIVEEGRVRRITLGARSSLRLANGIGIGAVEAVVRRAYPTFREEPHKYVEAPGKYLTDPDAANGRPALRFEIGADGKVSLIHAGTVPVLEYVEGCA